MKFIAIIVAFAIERFFGFVQRWRGTRPFERYCNWVRRGVGDGALWDGPVGVVVILLGPLLFTSWLQGELDEGVAMVFFGVPFAIGILVACIGPQDVGAQLRKYRDAIVRDDAAGAERCAQEMLGSSIPAETRQRHRKIIEYGFRSLLDWLPGVLFWFLLLGPVGAVLYRLAEVMERCVKRSNEQSDFANSVEVLYGLLAWIPARLTLYAFALTGSLDDALANARAAGHGIPWFARHQPLMLGAGLGAQKLNLSETSATLDQLHATIAMLSRVLWAWLAIAAVATLLGI